MGIGIPGRQKRDNLSRRRYEAVSAGQYHHGTKPNPAGMTLYFLDTIENGKITREDLVVDMSPCDMREEAKRRSALLP